MKISKLTLAIATVLGAGATSGAYAMDLYVDTKTKQIYAEPGPHRQLMGNFEKVDNAPAKVATKEEKLDKAEIAKIREDLALKDNAIKALQENAAEATKPDSINVTMDKKGLRFESRDKNYKFKIGGRIQADADYIDGGRLQAVTPSTGVPTGAVANANNGTEFRRARLDFEATVWKDWSFKTEVDFANNAVSLKDLWLRYGGLSFMDITGGQQKQNFSREVFESDNDLLFTEYSLMYVLNKQITERAIGLNFQTKDQKQWSGAVGIFGDTAAASSTANTASKAGEGWAISGRFTAAPIEEKTKVVHLGISGNYRRPNQNDFMQDVAGMTYQYKVNNLSNLSLLNTNMTGINSVKMLGLEANGMYGPYSVGAEYTHQWVDRKGTAALTNVEFDGFYTEAAWTITGESRKYKNGKFSRLEPAKPFSLKNGGFGAWELATRYSFVDVNSGNYLGGKASNVTVGLNWHINSNLRFMADYSRTFNLTNPSVKTSAGTDPDNVDNFTLRAQMAY